MRLCQSGIKNKNDEREIEEQKATTVEVFTVVAFYN